MIYLLLTFLCKQNKVCEINNSEKEKLATVLKVKGSLYLNLVLSLNKGTNKEDEG